MEENVHKIVAKRVILSENGHSPSGSASYENVSKILQLELELEQKMLKKFTTCDIKAWPGL